MHKHLLLLTLFASLTPTYATDLPENGDSAKTSEVKSQPRDARGCFKRKPKKAPIKRERDGNLVQKEVGIKLADLNPKRNGTWYTENELGMAAGLLQGVYQSDGFLRRRNAGSVKAEQLSRLATHFGEARGTKIFNAIIVQETSMNVDDVKAMKAFVDNVHESDKAQFQKYIKNIEAEIPTVDQENLKENAQRFEEGDSGSGFENSNEEVVLRPGLALVGNLTRTSIEDYEPALRRLGAFRLSNFQEEFRQQQANREREFRARIAEILQPVSLQVPPIEPLTLQIPLIAPPRLQINMDEMLQRIIRQQENAASDTSSDGSVSEAEQSE